MSYYSDQIAAVEAMSLPQVAKNAAIAAIKAEQAKIELTAALAEIDNGTLPEVAKAAARAALMPVQSSRRSRNNGATAATDGNFSHLYNHYNVADSDVITVRTLNNSGNKSRRLFALLHTGMTANAAIAAGCSRGYLAFFADAGSIALNGITGRLSSPQPGSPNAAKMQAAAVANVVAMPQTTAFEPSPNNAAVASTGRHFGLVKKVA